MTSIATDGPPPPLVVAASLTAVEGVLLVLLGVAEVATFDGGRAAMGATTTVFFVAYGAALLFCAWSVMHRSSWARSPIVLAQLIQLGVASSFWGGDTKLLAIGLVVAAAIVLVGVLHPASLEHLADERA